MITVLTYLLSVSLTSMESLENRNAQCVSSTWHNVDGNVSSFRMDDYILAWAGSTWGE